MVDSDLIFFFDRKDLMSSFLYFEFCGVDIPKKRKKRRGY